VTKVPLHTAWPAEVATLTARLRALDAEVLRLELCQPSKAAELRREASAIACRIENIKCAVLCAELNGEGQEHLLPVLERTRDMLLQLAEIDPLILDAIANGFGLCREVAQFAYAVALHQGLEGARLCGGEVMVNGRRRYRSNGHYWLELPGVIIDMPRLGLLACATAEQRAPARYVRHRGPRPQRRASMALADVLAARIRSDVA
jgi:hypothetical protein